MGREEAVSVLLIVGSVVVVIGLVVGMVGVLVAVGREP